MDTATQALNQLTSPTHGIASSTRERALVLLGQNISTGAVASACGVSESAISQLLSDENFAAQVAELRFLALQKHNEQDSEYDSIEAELTKKFKQALPLMMRPMEILKGLQVINQQKRRGAVSAENPLERQQIVSINLPNVIINNFTSTQVETNIHNQVVKVGDKDLTTMQSNSLLNLHKKKLAELPAISGATNVQTSKVTKPRRDPTDI